MSTNYGFEPTLDGLNNIDADSSTTTNIICDTIQINVSGTAPTVSALSNDTNIATTAWVTNHASATYVTISGTQTITGEKTFSNANTFITGNTVTNNIVSALATSNINIGANLTTGDILLGNSAAATNVALSWGGSSNSGNLSFTGGSFTLTASGVYTLRSGPTFNTIIADTQSTGIMNIATKSDRSGAININSGATSTAPVNISISTTLNAPITIGSSSSTTQTLLIHALTTFKKLVVVDDGILLRLGFSTTGLSMGKTGTNAITFKLLDSSDTLYFQNSTGSSIMYLNATEIINSKPTTFSDTTTHTGSATFNGSSTFNNDILVQQSTYPSSNTSQLGYTLTVAGTAGNTTTNVWKTLNQIDIPSKGVWLFVGLFELDVVAGQPGDIEQLRFGLSSVAPVSFTRVSNIEYYREADDTVSLNDIRDRLQVSGVFTTTAAATYYFSARLKYTGFVASDLQTKGNSTLTRIG